MIKDDLGMNGRLKIELKGPDGKIKETKEVTNTVTNDGKEWVAQRMGKATADLPSLMTHMAIGTDTTAASPTQTNMTGEQSRQQLTSTTVDSDSNEVVYVASFGTNQPSTAAAITEAGIFNASSNGVMLCRTDFNEINKGTGDTLTITWTVEAS